MSFCIYHVDLYLSRRKIARFRIKFELSETKESIKIKIDIFK